MKQEAILIHGWDPKYYNRRIEGNRPEGVAWSHRAKLIKELSKYYNIFYYNLPGFCGVKEPNKKKYSVEDFVDDFWKWKKKSHKDANMLVGYSFGGAVLLKYKVKYNDPTPAVLISPAIFRSQSHLSEIAGCIRPFIPAYYIDYFRHIYQYAVSKYYRQGTLFLQLTYDTVVREDLRPLLSKIVTKELLLVYGENDEDTPWKLVENVIIGHKINYYLIRGGGHAIGQTHPDEIIKAINEFHK